MEPVPLFTITITASVVAWYAAIVSTIAVFIQIAHFFRDRTKLSVSYQRDMAMANAPAYAGMTITLVRVVNTGRRKLTLTHLGAMRLKSPPRWLITDAVTSFPRVLQEGEQLQVLVDHAGLDFDHLRSFEAYDA